MTKKLEDRCKELIENLEYEKCEKEIKIAMAEMPHSAIPHNLMGILLEKEQNHILAMKHFRAACGLEPTYIPAQYNLQQYAKFFRTENDRCAYTEEDCPLEKISKYKIVYDERHIGHLQQIGRK